MGFVHEVLALVLPGALFTVLTHWVRFRLRRTEGYALLFYTLLAGWLIQQAVGFSTAAWSPGWAPSALNRSS